MFAKRRTGMMVTILLALLVGTTWADPFKVGFAERDITPPQGFPMAGYYHERLADGMLDPLLVKAMVLRDGDTQAAVVICDLIGIASDLSHEVRRRASEATGIPKAHIVIAATHTHTAPDYMKELWLHLGDVLQDAEREKYIEKLLAEPVEAIVRAQAAAEPVKLESGAAAPLEKVSFNRRFVMRDGSVRTWANYSHPDVVREAGPIDPEIGVLAIRNTDGKLRGLFHSFALHLDTVGGTKWSADYPSFISRTLRQHAGENVVSIFATGCCGDINHVDPSRPERNKADFIGQTLGAAIQEHLGKLAPVIEPRLAVRSRTVHVPLQDATREEVDRAIEILGIAAKQEKVDFYDHVTAYKKLLLDQFRHSKPFTATQEHITWGLSRSLAGIGDTLPVDVTVIAIGHDVALVFLPGEVFVDLGLDIKRASPYRHTLVVELANCVETIYIPHRAAYAGGSYEVTNSAVQAGAGEILVQEAVGLLREAASASR